MISKEAKPEALSGVGVRKGQVEHDVMTIYLRKSINYLKVILVNHS